jgi:hypothetical protein
MTVVRPRLYAVEKQAGEQLLEEQAGEQLLETQPLPERSGVR